MKRTVFFSSIWLLCVISLSSCVAKNDVEIGSSNDKQTEQVATDQINETWFDSMLLEVQANGSILVYSPVQNTFWSNDFQWANTGRIPASTYKIPHSIIALETEVVESDQTMFYWDGQDRALEVWEQDLTFKQAFQKSCVPCYQQVARKVGVERMTDMLQKLNYGKMVFDSTNLDEFWLTGESTISQFEQLDFLQRLMRNQLPISEKTRSTVLNMMELEEVNDGMLRGKTGWAIRNDQNNGWFVGFLESKADTLYVAVNINPLPEMDMKIFPRTRYELAVDALKFINEKQNIHE